MKKNLTISAFSQIPIFVFNDKNLSLSEKGLYAYLLCKSPKWVFNYNQVSNELQETEEQLHAYMKKLEDTGYIITNTDNSYDFFETPIIKTEIPTEDSTGYNNNNNNNPRNLNKNPREEKKKDYYDYNRFLTEWNKFCNAAKGNTHKCLSLNENRKAKLRTQFNSLIPVWKEKNPDKDFIAFVMEDIIAKEWGNSRFLQKENQRSNVNFNIEWILKPNMLLKMAEGNFRDGGNNE